MDIEKIITIIASMVGAFWIVLQIITHAREKGHRNIVVALVIILVGAVPAVIFLVLQQQDRASTTILSTAPSPVPPTIVGTSGEATASPPAASQTTTPPFESASPLATVPISPESMASASPRPSNPTDTVQAAFLVDFNHNLLGGLSQVVLQCTFTEAGSQAVTFNGYQINVHVRVHSEDAARDHVFDRVLATPIQVLPGAPLRQELPVDAEIGDLLVAYRKRPSNAWVHMTWKGTSADGHTVEASCDNNKQGDT